MTVYLLSFIVFMLSLCGLSVGRLLGRGGIRGSCGGLNNPEGCGACGRRAGSDRTCPKRWTA